MNQLYDVVVYAFKNKVYITLTGFTSVQLSSVILFFIFISTPQEHNFMK